MPTDARLITRALGASFWLYIVFGLPDGILGTIWPNLRDDFGKTDSGLGFVILCVAIGYFVGSVSSGHLSERLGVGTTLPMAMTVAAFSLAAVATATEWAVFGVAYVALGVGWGLTDAGINSWMTLTQGPRAMGLLHASYGVGAFAGPLVATGFVADDASWRAPYVVCVVLTLTAIAALVRARPGFAVAATTQEVTDAGMPSGSNRLLFLMVVWFSLYVGLEVAVGSWSFTLLTEARGESDVTAGVITACFWGGLMAGRFVLALIGHRLRPERAVWHSTALAAVATIALWIDPGGIGWAAIPVIGLGLSMMFPVVMGRTAVYLGEARATRAVGYQIGASSVGFTVLPAFIGLLADDHGVEWATSVFVVTVVALAGLWLAIDRATRPIGVVEDVSPAGW